jgi:hypothetical protein
LSLDNFRLRIQKKWSKEKKGKKKGFKIHLFAFE